MTRAALLVLADGRFPAGGHAHSGGAEAAVKAGRITDPVFTREAVEHTGAMYLAGADPHQPLLSPAV
ncbi:urease accessory protein UreF, partial [Streptomyces eurythermus]